MKDPGIGQTEVSVDSTQMVSRISQYTDTLSRSLSQLEERLTTVLMSDHPVPDPTPEPKQMETTTLSQNLDLFNSIIERLDMIVKRIHL